jgi:outer membrane protein assembly factor BamB
MSDPILHKGTLFLHTQLDNQGDKKYFLSAVRENGTPVWDLPLREALKFPPIINQQGQLFLFMENRLDWLGSVEQEQLAAQPALYPRGGMPFGLFLYAQKGVSVRATPTLGLNNMLYLSTDQGLFAITSTGFPSIFWQYTTQDNAFGPVALSPDEGTVYVVDGKGGALVALDNTDGTPKWSRQMLNPPDHPSCKKDTPQDVENFQTYPPVPVVGKDGRIYVTDGYFKDQVHYPGRCLQVFTATGQTLQPITTGGPQALLSQAVIDAQGQAYFIQEQDQAGTGRLCVWNPQQAATPQCSANADTLNAHNILVMDGNDHIYVLDSINNPQRIQGYTKQFARLFDLQVPQTASVAEGRSTNFMRNLLVAPDGTLYTRNHNHLFAVTPSASP